MDVASFEPASVAANHPSLPHNLSQLPIKQRLYLFQCAHAYMQQFGIFNKNSFILQDDDDEEEANKKQLLSSLFSTMCEELGCLDSIGSEGFVWFSLLSDFEATSDPFRGRATYNYLTAESIKLGAGNKGEVVSDSVEVAQKKAVVAYNQAQDKNTVKAHVNSLV